jgi:hypothetical protein
VTFSPSISPTFSVSPTSPPPPERFKLTAVYPNPVPSGGGKFVLSVPRPAVLHFKLYDLRGELIWDKVQPYPLAGNYELSWPAQNNAGSAVSYGAYYLAVKAKMANGDEFDGRWISVVR